MSTTPAQQPDYIGFIRRYLDCPCRYFAPMADDEPLMAAYRAARERGEREGFVPMIVVPSVTLAEALTDCEDFDLEEVQAGRQALLAAPLREGNAAVRELMETWKAEAEEYGLSWGEIGEIAGGEALDRFLGYWDYSSKKTEPLLLAEIPVRHPWEVFAYLPFGGWNECPDAPVQMEMAKYWFERYAAVPAVVTSDVLEYILPAPVKEEDAAALALEQYAFCADIVDQGVGTLGALADGLRQSTTWYFWWD